MNINPVIKAYRNLPKIDSDKPSKQSSKGLLSRNEMPTNKNKANNKNDISLRVARYVDNIRNFNVKDDNA